MPIRYIAKKLQALRAHSIRARNSYIRRSSEIPGTSPFPPVAPRLLPRPIPRGGSQGSAPGCEHPCGLIRISEVLLAKDRTPNWAFSSDLPEPALCLLLVQEALVLRTEGAALKYCASGAVSAPAEQTMADPQRSRELACCARTEAGGTKSL